MLAQRRTMLPQRDGKAPLPLPQSAESLGRRVTRWRVLGENVGFGGDVRSLHKAFMESPAHRDNILFDRYRHVGVGVKRSGGLMWVTVVFEASKDPGTRLSMPSC